MNLTKPGRKFQLWALFATFVVTVLCVVFSLTFISNHNLSNRVAAESKRNAAALCALRSSLNQNIAERATKLTNTEDFLRKHPGPLIIGLPRGLFTKGLADDRQSLNAQVRNLIALRFIYCPPNTPPYGAK